jgi:PhnB protein
MAQAKRPEGMHTLTTGLVVRGCKDALDFYRRALGAEVGMRMDAPDGKSIMHAQVRVGDSTFFVNDEMPGMGRPAPSSEHPAPVTLWVAVPDCDAAHQRAVKAGARSTMPPADMFWGDRVGGVADPYGYQWSFAQHQKDMSPDEMRRAGEAWMRSNAPKK